MHVERVTLTGRRIELRPLDRADTSALMAIGLNPELWRLTTKMIQTEQDMLDYVDTALKEESQGVALPFVTTLRETGEIVGSTRFAAIVPAHKRLEIGWTWITPAWQRSFVNTEAKFLMLTHAFETLGCNRVEFKTSHRNNKSQSALERIGAKREGTFRNHMIHIDGTPRHSVYFSIIREEWPEVKATLRKAVQRSV